MWQSVSVRASSKLRFQSNFGVISKKLVTKLSPSVNLDSRSRFAFFFVSISSDDEGIEKRDFFIRPRFDFPIVLFLSLITG